MGQSERSSNIGDPAPIVVINPNSSERITAQIADAVAASDVEVVRSKLGPPAIETDADVAASIPPMLEMARTRTASAVVVACFSDPGVDELRAESTVPVVGIAEAAVREALRHGRRIGVISSLEASLPRHERYWKKLGLEEDVVADIPVGLGVLELDTAPAEERAVAAGREVVAAGADVIVLGCTGMTHMQARLEGVLGVPVIDPCRAAVEAARSAAAGDRP